MIKSESERSQSHGMVNQVAVASFTHARMFLVKKQKTRLLAWPSRRSNVTEKGCKVVSMNYLRL